MRQLIQHLRNNKGLLKLFLAVAGLAISAEYAQAAGRPDLRFVEKTELPNAGIKFKMMPQSAEMPLPPPSTATYTMRTSTGEEKRQDMYSPYELWIHEQHAGMWTDKEGNRLSLAVIRFPMPVGFKHHHATRADYNAAAAKLISAQKEWSLNDLTSWVKNYLKENDITAIEIEKRPFKFSRLVEFRFSKNAKNRFAFAFILNKSATGQQMALPHMYFVYIECNPNIDPAKALQSVQKEFIGSVGVPAMAAEHKVTESRAFRASPGSLIPDNNGDSDEYKRSRTVVKQSIANLKDWWFVETDHFIILSNLGLRYKSTLSDLQSNIEHLRYAYELLLPPAKPIKAVSVIRVPGSGEEYKGYVGEQYAWSGGLWMSARRELVIRAADAGSSKSKKEQMLSTSYHEGFHQYLFYALDQCHAHAWFNEGHACFFESVTLNNTRFIINEHEYMAKDVDKMIAGKAFNLSALIQMDYKTFYGGSDINRRNNYASAWLLVYYLRKCAAFEQDSPYSGICSDYYSELIKTRDPSVANKKAFEGIDLKQLEADIIKFWETRNIRVKARYNSIFKDYKPGARR